MTSLKFEKLKYSFSRGFSQHVRIHFSGGTNIESRQLQSRICF